jgi:hypothetical protein
VRKDDNPAVFEERLREYYKKTAPLIGYYYAKGKLKTVDGMASMDEVTAQIAFDLIVAVDGLADCQNFGIGQLIDAAIGRDADLFDDLGGKPLANAVNILKRDDHALVGRDIDAGYTGHFLLHVGRSSRRVC